MYRALDRAALDRGVDLDDGDAARRLMSRLRFGLSGANPPRSRSRVRRPSELLDRIGSRLRSRTVARHPQVRALMREGQRRSAIGGAVIEGRDIGTVVFPDATVKLFLTAAPQTRVARRAEERAADPAEVEEPLHRRDVRDARVNPFEPARRRDRDGHGRALVERDAGRSRIAIVRERLPGLFV